MGTINIEGQATTVAVTRPNVEAVQTNKPEESTETNVFLGGEAVASVKEKGEANTAIGAKALKNVTTGQFNTAIGHGALEELETTNFNIAIGNGAMLKGKGEENLAIGKNALKIAGAESADNVAVGPAALTVLTKGTDNVAVGNSAGKAITTGKENVVVGKGAGNAVTTGTQNTYVGTLAGAATVGNSNVAVGYKTGAEAGEGVSIGVEAGDGQKGSKCIFIGFQAGKAAATEASKLYIGNNATKAIINGVMSATESSQEIGFLGAAPAKRPKVKGSRETEAEEILKTLTKGLAELGLITDETTA